MADPDIEKNKLLAIVGYIVPILFFVPLITEGKNSPFARFHANQQLVLLIVAIAVNIAGTMIPFIGWILILPVGVVAVIVLAVLGILNASRGEMKRLPVIGGAELIK
ncbi:MAG: putative rane protein [Deltaproteobacteria bacterium]|nr:putative rane protein [Deltaproteobacteria bacterium]